MFLGRRLCFSVFPMSARFDFDLGVVTFVKVEAEHSGFSPKRGDANSECGLTLLLSGIFKATPMTARRSNEASAKRRGFSNRCEKDGIGWKGFRLTQDGRVPEG